MALIAPLASTTESGIVRSVMSVPAKAPSPMDFKSLLKVTLVKCERSNASSPIDSIPAGKVTSVIGEYQKAYLPIALSFDGKPVDTCPSAPTTLRALSLPALPNALYPIFSTLSETTTSLRRFARKKASSEISVNPAGSEIFRIPLLLKTARPSEVTERGRAVSLKAPVL